MQLRPIEAQDLEGMADGFPEIIHIARLFHFYLDAQETPPGMADTSNVRPVASQMG